MSWEVVCRPKKYGGLGVRRLITFNRAFLGIWLWQFAVERDRLWRRIIEAKYGADWGD